MGNIVLDNIDEVAKLLQGNSLLYEFLKSKKYHSCWVRWIPVDQAGRTYIKVATLHEMLTRNMLKQYFYEETESYIHKYYVLL